VLAQPLKFSLKMHSNTILGNICVKKDVDTDLLMLNGDVVAQFGDVVTQFGDVVAQLLRMWWLS
jgi:hypothetical protein